MTVLTPKEQVIAAATLAMVRAGFSGLDAVAIARYSTCAYGECAAPALYPGLGGYVCRLHATAQEDAP